MTSYVRKTKIIHITVIAIILFLDFTDLLEFSIDKIYIMLNKKVSPKFTSKYTINVLLGENSK